MATVDATASQRELLSAGWEALERTEWKEARACFEGALARHTSAEALEGLAWAAWWLNDQAAMFRNRERAYALYRRRGDRRSAGRVATLLAIDFYSFKGKAAVGNGWFRRAHRLLEGLPPAPEHGWLSIWEGQIALIAGNDPATARRLGAEAAALGRSLEEVDIEMTGLALEGLALVTAGEVEEGMPRLDEATAAAIGGDMSEPWGIGATCCYLIYACERVRDFDRAVQWCERVQEFCRELNWVSLFATCRTHHASVLLWQGAWGDAEAELEAAMRELESTQAGKVADGIIRLAELRRRQGRLEEAAALLARVGLHPHALLGQSALALDRGRAVDALDLLRRFLRKIPEENRTDRAAALELAVRAHAVLGQIDDARAALLELEAHAEAVATDAMWASTALARGTFAAAQGHREEGRGHLEDAVDLFERAGAPFEAGRARLELAQVLADLGRLELAVAEARTAHNSLSLLGGELEARRAAALLRKLGAVTGGSRAGGEPTFGLSARELEVLGLVAQGLSNGRIAEALVLSEHTVRRHVANILKKMDVPSRTAAAMVAARHDVL